MTIAADYLQQLKQRGVDSPLLDARLAFMQTEGCRRYVEEMTTVERVFPDMLPTQASGRWSTTNPPLVNFPKACINPTCPFPKPHESSSSIACWGARDVIALDSHEWGLKWDLDGVEARLFAAYAGDEEDVRAFKRGLDLHTMTTCTMYGLPLPPNLVDPHTSPSCAEWRAEVGWGGKEDTRRTTAKNLRYGVLQYGTNEKAAAGIRDIERLGLTRAQLFVVGAKLLASKPEYTAFKRLSWGQAIEQGQTRTFLGRKRRFYPTRQEKDGWERRGVPGDAAKAGLNHRIQGAVADMMNLTLIQVLSEYPDAVLHLNAHDGALVGFPNSLKPEDVVPVVAPMIVKEWSVEGQWVLITASGAIVWPDGRAEKVGFLCL